MTPILFATSRASESWASRTYAFLRPSGLWVVGVFLGVLWGGRAVS